MILFTSPLINDKINPKIKNTECFHVSAEGTTSPRGPQALKLCKSKEMVVRVCTMTGAGGPEAAGAGEAAGEAERGRAGGQSRGHQCPHTAFGGEPAAVCQAASNWCVHFVICLCSVDSVESFHQN